MSPERIECVGVNVSLFGQVLLSILLTVIGLHEGHMNNARIAQAAVDAQARKGSKVGTMLAYGLVCSKFRAEGATAGERRLNLRTWVCADTPSIVRLQ